MKCSLLAICAALLLTTPAALSQTVSPGDLTAGLSENTPADNASGGAVRERSPARIVDSARARHRALAQARRAAQVSRDASSLLADPGTTSTSGSSDLLGSLLGGGSSNLLSTLLNSGLLGSLTGTTGTTGTTGSSSLPPEVLQMIQAAGIDVSSLNLKSKDSTASEVKTSSLTQQTSTTTTTEPRSFGARWADAMFSTFFTAVTVGFQTPDFIKILKDAFRPFLIPGSTTNTAADSTGGTTQNPNTGGSI